MFYLKVGDKIAWKSAAGSLTATIKEINLAPSAAETIQPWVVVEDIFHTDTNKKSRAPTMCFCGSHSNLLMLQVSKIEKD
jgi:hypothetical protein